MLKLNGFILLLNLMTEGENVESSVVLWDSNDKYFT